MRTIDMERALIPAGLFAAAMAVRLVGLGASGYDLSEIIGLEAWRADPGAFWTHLSSIAGAPLYYVFIGLWSLVSNAEWWVRLPSAIFSSLAVVFAFLLVEQKVTRPTAVVAALFLALHPMSIRAGSHVSSIPLAALFVTISAYYAALWLGTHGEHKKVKTAVFAALALYTHHYAWFYAVFLVFAALSTAIRPAFRKRFAAAPVAVMGALALPLVPLIAAQWANAPESAHQGILWSIKAFAAHFPFGNDPLQTTRLGGLLKLFPGGAWREGALFILALPVMALGIWGGVRHAFLGFLFALPLAGGVFLGRTGHPFEPIVMVVFAAAGFACVAAGIGELSKFKRPGQIAAGLAAVAIAGTMLLSFCELRYQGRSADGDVKSTMAALAKAAPREWILSYSAEQARDLKYYESGPWQFKPLAPDDRTAAERGGAGLAEQAKKSPHSRTAWCWSIADARDSIRAATWKKSWKTRTARRERTRSAAPGFSCIRREPRRQTIRDSRG
ncbi:MAG: glycosyltransferase family 39 protein [Deltaproteobacteria bacterium]|nr:glycosyltransferase family 39 protein [Deltaproteobacteria bacterium]